MNHLPPHSNQINTNYYCRPQNYQEFGNVNSQTLGPCQISSDGTSNSSLFQNEAIMYQRQSAQQQQVFSDQQQPNDSLYSQARHLDEPTLKQNQNTISNQNQSTTYIDSSYCNPANLSYIHHQVNPVQPTSNQYAHPAHFEHQMYEPNLHYSAVPIVHGQQQQQQQQQQQHFQYEQEPIQAEFADYQGNSTTVVIDESGNFSSQLQDQSHSIYQPNVMLDIQSSYTNFRPQQHQHQQNLLQFRPRQAMMDQQRSIVANLSQVGYEAESLAVQQLSQPVATNQTLTLANQIPRSKSNVETSFAYENHQQQLQYRQQQQQLNEPSTYGSFQEKQGTLQLANYKIEHAETPASSNSNNSNIMATASIRQSQSQRVQQRSSQQEHQERSQQQEFVDLKASGVVSQDWLDTICTHVNEHMNSYGICVIDNFLGPVKGDLILKEVQQLYNGGQYTRGRLVNNKLTSIASSRGTEAIRNDRVIWIDGCEEGCSEINNLIQTLCSVIMNSSRLSLYSNKGLDKVVINKRTRAHVACYPGVGTRYIKHVDNPNDDGRVITSIYYLNKDWFSKRDGGLLRMFPADINEVANIEPLFDRVLFFWSDRRNPHEVLPAYRDRFAITVWYIGENRSS